MKNKNNSFEFCDCQSGNRRLLSYLSVIAAIFASIILFLFIIIKGAISYAIYSLAAVFSVYLIYNLIKIIPKAKSLILELLNRNSAVSKVVKDKRLRAIALASCSFVVNIGYAVFNAIVAIISKSQWLGSLAFYYSLLVMLRGSVIFSHRKENFENATSLRIEIKRLKVYRRSGIILLSILAALIAAVSQMVIANESFKYVGLMIYVGALYTTIKVTVAIVNFLKIRKMKDVTVETIRNINLADAGVSILALQSAMLQSFSGGQTAYFNVITGTAICALILGLAIFMIVKANTRLKKLKGEDAYE